MRTANRIWFAPVVVAVFFGLLATGCSGPSPTAEGFDATETAQVSDSSPTANADGPQATSSGSTAAPSDPSATVSSSPGMSTPTEDPAIPAATPAPPDSTMTEPPPAPSETPESGTPDPTGSAPPVTSYPDPVNANATFRQVASGFIEPTVLTHAGDGTGTVYVAEKRGALYTLDGAPFIDLTDRVIDTGLGGNARELGFLGLAFHPDFESNGYFFVHYNDLNGNTVISRFQTRADGSGDPESEELLITLNQPEDHFNGGTLLFGRDGYLYIAIGTGGNREIDHLNAQDLGSMFGKLLRIDIDSGSPYGIPPDNPFVGVDGAEPEIWAYGLRNPWRMDFDEATGDLYIAEPGQFGFEWVHFEPAGPNGIPDGGANYGWPFYEGFHCFDIQSETASDASNCSPPENYQPPIFEYPRGQNGGCVIIGGLAYRGGSVPNLQGAYLYSDFCSGLVSAAWRDAIGSWQTTPLFDVPGLVSSFGEDESGETYLLSISDGIVYQITQG